MSVVDIEEKKQLLSVDQKPVEPAEYWEYVIFEVPVKYTEYSRGSWRVTGRGLIRRLLLGPEQEPHSGGSNVSTGNAMFVPIAGIVSHSSQGWVRCNFTTPLKEVRSITATLLDPPKLSSMPREFIVKFQLPEINIPNIVIPPIPTIEIYCYGCTNPDCSYGFFSFVPQTRCPKCGSDLEQFVGDDRFEMVMKYRAKWSWNKRLGNWWILNPLRDAISSTLVWLQYDIFGLDAAFMPINLIVSYIDYVRNSLTRLRINTQSVINEVINDLNNAINDTGRKQVNEIEKAVNNVFTDLYRAWGMLARMVNPPIQVRNVSNKGFEVYIPYPNAKVAINGVATK